jgi:hypothetical protein
VDGIRGTHGSGVQMRGREHAPNTPRAPPGASHRRTGPIG